MKKIMTLFALSGMLTACNNKEKIDDNNIITLNQQHKINFVSNKPSPCVIEVSCDEPGLKVANFKEKEAAHKYYNFCDSSVIISGYTTSNYGGPVFSKRSITDLHGTEKVEMEAAYAKYKNSLEIK